MGKKFAAAWVVILCIVFFSAGQASSAQETPAKQGLAKIGDNVYSYADIKKSSPKNSFGANAGIIVDRDGIVVVDTLISSKEARRFIRDIRKVSDKPVKYVVNTHYHLDHAFGNADFRRLGSIIISHSDDYMSMANNNENALKNAKDYGLTESDMEGTKIVLPALTFNDRMEIYLGNQKIELIHSGVSHTEGSIMVYLPDKKILFAGDILFTGYHPFIADGNIEEWVKVLDYIMTMDVEKIIPGHGPVSSKKDVEDMKKYLLLFDAKAKELAGNSNDIDYITSEIKKALPARPEGEWLIQANIQMKYMKK